MNFDWYKIFNLTEFLEEDLISRNLTVSLEGIGEKELLIINGNETSIVYEDVILPIRFKDQNPFIKEGSARSYAVYIDAASDVWLGVEVGS